MAARCFGMLCQVMTLDLMTFIIEKIVPLMDIADNVIYRQGATEALACILSIFSKKKKDHMTGLMYNGLIYTIYI